MLHLPKKLKLYTKLGPQTIHKALIRIHMKTYLWSFVDYLHLKKYFYNWNIITLNYCFIYKIDTRDKFIWICPWLHQMPIFWHYLAHCAKSEWLKKLWAASDNDHVLQVLKFYFWWQNKFLSICLPVWKNCI